MDCFEKEKESISFLHDATEFFELYEKTGRMGGWYLGTLLYKEKKIHNFFPKNFDFEYCSLFF